MVQQEVVFENADENTVRQLACSLCPYGIPDVAIEVVVAGQQQPTRLRERNRRDATNDVVVAVHGQLLVGPDVEEPAGGVIRPRGESAPVREEGDRIDVGFVAGEGLLAHAFTDVPQLYVH